MLFLASCTATAEPREYSLSELVDLPHKQPAPPDIVVRIVALEKQGLDDDRRQQLWTDESTLLSVVPVNLRDDGPTDYLVFPTQYLPTFFGIHSIACWVFKGNADGTHELILVGRHDEVRIREHKTNGFRDIDLVYGAAEEEVRSFQYNGSRYVRK
jgi:hypothetical protein